MGRTVPRDSGPNPVPLPREVWSLSQTSHCGGSSAGSPCQYLSSCGAPLVRDLSTSSSDSLHELGLEPRDEATEHVAGPAGEKVELIQARHTQTGCAVASGCTSVGSKPRALTWGLQGQNAQGTKMVPAISTVEGW